MERRGSTLRTALLSSALLHLLVLALLPWVPEQERSERPAPRRIETIEVGLDARQSEARRAGPGFGASATTSRNIPSPRPTAQDARAPGRTRSTLEAAQDAMRVPSQEPASNSVADQVSGTGIAPGSGAGPRRRSPQLSLEALGIAPGAHPLWAVPKGRAPSRAQRREDEARASERRLARSMQQHAVDHDSEIGLGPHGPILRTLGREAVRSLIAAPSHALVLATLDERGRLSLSVLEANRDYDKWAEVARRSRITLASAALRPPAGARGLELEVRVEVRDELPSGADPGLEVDLLGIPLKHGKGDRSARLSLLEPKVEVVEVEVPSLSGQTVKLPQLAIGVVPFGLAGDPADMGAKAQRRVHLTVTRRSVL